MQGEIDQITRRLHNPVSVEDLLEDNVMQAFPNVRRLLQLYILIPHSEAVAERGFSKMSQIMTKKRCTLDEQSLDMLMRISYRVNPLTTLEVKTLLTFGKN